MFKRKVIAILFIAILALGACKPQATPVAQDTSSPQATSAPQATASPEATSITLTAALTELVGKVDMKNPGQDSFLTAGNDSVLQAQGQIQTGDDGRVRLDLSSGTIIRVAPSSIFTLTSNEGVEGGLATKIKLELGKIFIILNGGSAEVETASGVASVRGSYLSVETIDGGIKLTCLEGDCGWTNPAGNGHFTDGQSIILPFPINGAFVLPEVGRMTLEDFQDWLKFNPEAKKLVDQALSGLGNGNSQNACFKVVGPKAGSELPFQGKVKFEWESQPGATKYTLTFKNAQGNIMSFDTTETSLEKYIEILPKDGQYDWDVTAYGGDGNAICKTEPVTFSKPNSNVAPNHDTSGEDVPACNPMDCQGSCPDPYTCGG